MVSNDALCILILTKSIIALIIFVIVVKLGLTLLLGEIAVVLQFNHLSPINLFIDGNG